MDNLDAVRAGTILAKRIMQKGIDSEHLTMLKSTMTLYKESGSAYKDGKIAILFNMEKNSLDPGSWYLFLGTIIPQDRDIQINGINLATGEIKLVSLLDDVGYVDLYDIHPDDKEINGIIVNPAGWNYNIVPANDKLKPYCDFSIGFGPYGIRCSKGPLGQF